MRKCVIDVLNALWCPPALTKYDTYGFTQHLNKVTPLSQQQQLQEFPEPVSAGAVIFQTVILSLSFNI